MKLIKSMMACALGVTLCLPAMANNMGNKTTSPKTQATPAAAKPALSKEEEIVIQAQNLAYQMVFELNDRCVAGAEDLAHRVIFVERMQLEGKNKAAAKAEIDKQVADFKKSSPQNAEYADQMGKSLSDMLDHVYSKPAPKVAKDKHVEHLEKRVADVYLPYYHDCMQSVLAPAQQ